MCERFSEAKGLSVRVCVRESTSHALQPRVSQASRGEVGVGGCVMGAVSPWSP